MEKQAKKKGWWLLAVLALALAMLPVTGGGKAWAAGEDTIIYDGLMYQVIDDETVMVLGYDPSSYDNDNPPTTLTIPSQVPDEKTYTVTEIANGAFGGRPKLTEITLPSSLTSIGYGAFQGCENLASITLPDSLTSIGNSAFSGCSGLESVDMLQATELKSIGENAFQNCTSLTGVIVPDSVTTIGQSAFYGCSQLGNVTLPKGLTTIANNLFRGSGNLTSITLPAGVTSIGDNAFYGCSQLKTVDMSQVTELTSIGKYAFHECNGLNSITLPDSVTTIGERAFENCAGLTSIKLPDKLTSIGDGAFINCVQLASITLPAEVTEIGQEAFKNCSSLASVDTSQVTKLTSIGKQAFYDCKGLTSIKLPDSLTSIGGGAFSYCEKLKSVDMSQATSLKSIGGATFYKCTALTEVKLPDTLEEIKTFTGEATGGKKDPLGAFEGCESLTKINLSDTKMTTIGEGTFASCIGLKSITLPAGVTSIDKYAFWYCTGLTEITLPAGVTSIGDFAFEGCTGLTEITLPAGVTSIGNNAFNGCADLRVIITGDEVPSDLNALKTLSAIKDVKITCTNPNLIKDLADELGKSEEDIKQVYDLKDVTITPSSITEQLYTGQPITPDVTLTGGTTFALGTDYTLAYSDNIKPGTGTVTITPTTTGSLYGKPIELPFTIYREYTVSFNDNGVTKATEKVREGSVFTLPDCDFTAEGKEFNGWQIGDDNTPYQPGYKITIDSDTTITATWKDKGQTDPTNPTDPDNPTEPSKPTDPTDPTKPTDPSNPTDPSKPDNPTDPSNPDNPTDPSNPTDPTDPTKPVDPNKPTDPTDPTDPSKPVDPNKPTTPTKPEGSKYYTITFDTDGGTLVNITGNKDYVIWGRTYKMPSATKSRYTFLHWAIGAKNSSNTVNANEVYTFTADTTVYAIWDYNGGGSSSRPSSSGSSSGGTTTPVKPEKPGTTDPGTPGTSSNTVTAANINNVFADVKNNAWYAEAIAYVYNKGIMNGTGNGQFEPNSPTTRAMLVTMLHRLENEPGAGAINFGDVASGQWYSQAIAWAAANGIVKGYSDTQFAPNDEITREQLAVILYRYAQFKGLDVSAKGDLSSFSDSQNVSDWAKEAMEWAVGAGIISGNDNGTIAPTANATRAEVAMMLMRFLVNT